MAKQFKFPITSLFCNWDAGYPQQVIQLVTLIGLMEYVSLFSFLSALGHLFAVWKWDWYVSDLK